MRSSVSITVIVMRHGRLRQARLVLACYRLDANRERLMTAIPLVAISP